MKKIIILFFIGLICVSGCSKQQNKYAADMRSVYGKWTAISKACVPGSTLNISEGKLEYISEGNTEDRKFNCEVQHLGKQEGICYPKWPCQKPMFILPKQSVSS